MHVRGILASCLVSCAVGAGCGGDSNSAVPTSSVAASVAATATSSGAVPATGDSSSGAPPQPTAAADPNALAAAVTTTGIGWTMQIDPAWTEVSELDVPAVAAWLLDGEGAVRLTVERYGVADLAEYAAGEAEAYLGFTGAQTLSADTSTASNGTEFWRAVAVAEREGDAVGLTTVAIDTGDEVIAARYIAPSGTYAATAATIEQFLLTLQPA